MERASARDDLCSHIDPPGGRASTFSRKGGAMLNEKDTKREAIAAIIPSDKVVIRVLRSSGFRVRIVVGPSSSV